MLASTAGVSTFAAVRIGRDCRCHSPARHRRHAGFSIAIHCENAINSEFSPPNSRLSTVSRPATHTAALPRCPQLRIFCTFRKSDACREFGLPPANRLFLAARLFMATGPHRRIRSTLLIPQPPFRPLSLAELRQGSSPARPHLRIAATDDAKSRTPPSSLHTAHPSLPSSACDA